MLDGQILGSQRQEQMAREEKLLKDVRKEAAVYTPALWKTGCLDRVVRRILPPSLRKNVTYLQRLLFQSGEKVGEQGADAAGRQGGPYR
jgi:hypothetical protein